MVLIARGSAVKERATVGMVVSSYQKHDSSMQSKFRNMKFIKINHFSTG